VFGGGIEVPAGETDDEGDECLDADEGRPDELYESPLVTVADDLVDDVPRSIE
jgi:hypothetical protein